MQIPVWLTNINNHDSPVDLKSITKTIESIMVQIKSNGLLSLQLSRLNYIDPNPQHLVVLLRILYQFKEKVNEWSKLISFTKVYLDKNGFDSDTVLKGLL